MCCHSFEMVPIESSESLFVILRLLRDVGGRSVDNASKQVRQRVLGYHAG